MNRSIYSLLFFSFIAVFGCKNKPDIDRYTLVTSHNIQNSAIDSFNTIPVGNGRYIFFADITGLQTLHTLTNSNTELSPLSVWCYDGIENEGKILVPDSLKPFLIHGRKIEYFGLSESYRNSVKSTAFHQAGNARNHLNPGIIELSIKKKDGQSISMNDIMDPVQKLNLWNWELDSKFKIEDIPVHVRTVCHHDYDMISVKINSELIRGNRLKIKIVFPPWSDMSEVNDINFAENRIAKIVSDTNNVAIFRRGEGGEMYNVLVWKNGAVIKEVAPGSFLLDPGKKDSVYSFSCQFMKNSKNGRIQTFGETETASRRSWQKFWNLCSSSDIQKLTENSGSEAGRLLIISKYLTEQRDIDKRQVSN